MIPGDIASVVLLLSCLWPLGCEHAGTARTEIIDAQGARVGEATLTESAEGVTVAATFTDLPPGEHALHVHTVGRCEAPFESAGPHFNPTGRRHGRDNPEGPHAGDLPNLQVSELRRASIVVLLPDVSLTDGSAALLDHDGASLVVHEKADDHMTDPAGGAGARIACGVLTGPKS
jgi:Cu-Zn family superoxide dismutase